jgi:type II secretory pathway predicted ATPase ExeA
MIAAHFQLREEPFQKAIPEGGLLRSRSFEEGLKRLAHLFSGDAIGLLIGETGSGKSTLLHEAARTLDSARTQVCYVSFTSLRSFGFLVHLGSLLGVDSRRFKGQMAKGVLDAAANGGRRMILLVDEAHRLPNDTLEDLRLLTTSDFDRKSAFTLVLSGQPLLKNRLDEPDLLSLRQRVTLRHAVAPLSEDELMLMRSYVASRRKIFWKLTLPKALPFIFAGLKTAFTFALIGAIVAEFVGTYHGLGLALETFTFALQMHLVFAVIVIISLLGIVLYAGLDFLDRKIVLWHREEGL